MVSIRYAADREVVDESWMRTTRSLDAPDGVSCLSQLDEIWIDCGHRVATQRHEGMAILMLVRDGILGHTDGLGNDARLLAGEVLMLDCDAGVEHSARNASGYEPLQLIVAHLKGAASGAITRFQRHYFSDDGKTDALSLLASADGRDGSLALRRDVNVYASLPKRRYSMPYRVAAGRIGYLQILSGDLLLGETPLSAGDSATLDAGEVQLGGAPEAELLLFDLPAAACSPTTPASA